MSTSDTLENMSLYINDMPFNSFIDEFFPKMTYDLNIGGMDMFCVVTTIAEFSKYPHYITPSDSSHAVLRDLKTHLYANRHMYDFWLL